MKKVSTAILFCLLLANLAAQRTVSFTFDDGKTNDYAPYTCEEWNQMILDAFAKRNIKAIFFVKGSAMDNERGKQILHLWDKAGHLIANHTYSHYNFNSTPLSDFEFDVKRNDSFLRHSGFNYVQLFRFPYLKEGDTPEKINGFRKLLKYMDYKNGHVTIDASDWYIDGRLTKRLEKDSTASIEGYKQYYLEHLYDRAVYYDSLAFALTGRHISHTLLLHHNLAAGLFIEDLMRLFEAKGWKIIGADEAYKDGIFKSEPTNIPAGESLIWALARQSGKFDAVLRYPAEDGSYEKEKMDKLGL